MSFLGELRSKGYFYQSTDLDGIKTLIETNQAVIYVGFDCTAESLHVGSLMQIMILRLAQKYNIKPIVILGGATSKIGDPSGKDETRKALTDDDIAKNIKGITKSLSKFIKFGTKATDAIILNNSTWLDNIQYLEFLREYGREFSISRMLSMDSVKIRLEREQNLTFLEFNYMLLQSYDFLHLAKNYNCTIQLGGSDQWGNIIMGAELIRRKLGKNVFGITTPLLTTSSGAKMGKSSSGAVWLNEDMLAPYDYYQYWRNIEDLDVIKFAKLYAEFEKGEQEEFEKLANDKINEAKKLLAHRLTALCHGQQNADNAEITAKKVFEEGGVGDSLPEFTIGTKELSMGLNLADLVYRCEFSTSKSEAKKLIRSSAIRVNNEKIADESIIIDSSFFGKEAFVKISAGKKRHALVKLI
ncbi:MAG: tyrosine--tRNA ligase [Rickettsiaceae bacterium]|nr:tyrosine--tRNA ligase [Rickettsiaceae bacterium]